MSEKTLESPLDCKEIKPVNSKGDQSWIFIGQTDVEAETPILWPPDVKNWHIRKDPDAGKDWRQEKGMTENKMVLWHHRLDGHEFEQAPGGWWWTGKPGVLQSMGSQRHDWATELNWKWKIQWYWYIYKMFYSLHLYEVPKHFHYAYAKIELTNIVFPYSFLPFDPRNHQPTFLSLQI